MNSQKEWNRQKEKKKNRALDSTVLSQVRFYVFFGEEIGISIFYLSHINPMRWKHSLSAAEYLWFKEAGSGQDSIKVSLSVMAGSSPMNSAQKPFYDPDITEHVLQQTW